MKPAILGKRCYFLLLVDNTSRIIWPVLLPTKGALADTIKQIQAVAEKESSHKLWVLRTNNSWEFTAYCADEGIQRYFSAPYSP